MRGVRDLQGRIDLVYFTSSLYCIGFEAEVIRIRQRRVLLINS